MTDRYHVARWPEDGVVILPREESHHFLRVMRGRIGDALTIFDGTGWEARCEVTGVEGGRVEARAGVRREVSREAEVALDVAVAIPKGSRMDGMLRALCELGVRRVLPVMAARAAVKPRPASADRWRRIVIEASKQSGRNVLMDVAAPRPFRDVLEDLPPAPLRLLPHPEAETTLADRLASDEGPLSPAISLVGPEGGFVAAEVGAALAAGFTAVRLGARILRIETAATAVAAAILVGRPSPGPERDAPAP